MIIRTIRWCQIGVNRSFSGHNRSIIFIYKYSWYFMVFQGYQMLSICHVVPSAPSAVWPQDIRPFWGWSTLPGATRRRFWKNHQPPVLDQLRLRKNPVFQESEMVKHVKLVVFFYEKSISDFYYFLFSPGIRHRLNRSMTWGSFM